MDIIETVTNAWGWTGLQPDQVVGENDFGNLLIKDINGRYWRLCPEDLYCKIVANNRAEFDELLQDEEFMSDWLMTGLVEQAEERIGPLRPGHKYCLKVPGVLGGEFAGANLAVVPIHELISLSGRIAEEIDGLPDGAQVELIVDPRPNNSSEPG
ncbi:T6SS immunity protein Tdi1 domain-containing protein [Calidithermus terrae]|uniref:T6SS immunity protein Tdi1 domain-containing protein n=1 Tax=Calidithermus terrae TaxID=1408545 RepID=UPI000E650F41|nr:T6SS immunity protein Tdi1 domain-containing protein [Calidithermus terrae]